jgi:hypothetical protein
MSYTVHGYHHRGNVVHHGQNGLKLFTRQLLKTCVQGYRQITMQPMGFPQNIPGE